MPCFCFLFTGYYQASSKSSCVECGVGKYQNRDTQTSCNDCPGGKFQDRVSSIGCKTCRSSEISRPGMSRCSGCAAGKYHTNKLKSQTCQECDIGRFQVDAGQISCTACSSGMYQNQLGQVDCFRCVQGKYSRHQSTTCTDCPAGRWSLVEAEITVHLAFRQIPHRR